MKRVMVKICGLTSAREAEYLNEAGADMAGMVMFFPKSKRNIDAPRAREIMDALAPEIKRVAVTVSPDPEQMAALSRMGFDLIQVHGALSDEAKAAARVPLLKAFNVTDLDTLGKYVDDGQIAGFVFDAAEYGSGKSFDWRLLEDLDTGGKLRILAGGLSPENVSAAVRAVKPDGVDVSSGVENDSGIGKDPRKIRDFVNNARR